MNQVTIHYNGIDKGSVEEFDGVAFLYNGLAEKNKETFDLWNVHYLKAPKSANCNFTEKKDLGFLYTICIRKHGEENIEVFNAILGDPIHFINNCMRAKEGGFIVKTSEWSKEIVEKFLGIWGT